MQSQNDAIHCLHFIVITYQDLSFTSVNKISVGFYESIMNIFISSLRRNIRRHFFTSTYHSFPRRSRQRSDCVRHIAGTAWYTGRSDIGSHSRDKGLWVLWGGRERRSGRSVVLVCSSLEGSNQLTYSYAINQICRQNLNGATVGHPWKC